MIGATVPVHNDEIAALLGEVADLLDLEGANPFRVRAYRNAARVVSALAQPVADHLRDGDDLSALPGIGADLAGKIEEICRTGALATLEELRGRAPPALVELLAVPGLGPKKVKALHEALGVRTLDDLRAAARQGHISALKGFGEKTEAKILEALARHDAGAAARVPWSVAEPVALGLARHLEGGPGVERVAVAGSFRRRKATVGDLDLLVSAADSGPVVERFVAFPGVVEVTARGGTRAAVRLREGLGVDLRVVRPESFGAALHYFTGSKAHNIAVRRRAQERGLKLNEYGVFRGEFRVGGATEEEVFRLVDLPEIPPELREDRGEIEAAAEGRLPALVDLERIRGDLHARLDDPRELPGLAAVARAVGLAYVAVAGPSRRELERASRQVELLCCVEAAVLPDGSLDLAEDADADLVIGAVAAGTGDPTEQAVRALRHPRCDVLGFRGTPDPRLDLERVLREAREAGVLVELGGRTEEAGLDDVHAHRAKELGVKVAVTSGARAADQLDLLRLAVGQARRGWLEDDDVVNTRPWAEVRRLLKPRRRKASARSPSRRVANAGAR